MLRYVVSTLGRRTSPAMHSLVMQRRQASNSAFLIKRCIPSSTNTVRVASFHTSIIARDDAEDAPVKKKRSTTATKKTTTTTAKKAATPKKVTKPKAKKAVTKVPSKPKRVLHPPKPIATAWVLYFKERLAAMPKEEKTKVAELTKSLVGDFRSLSSSERAALDSRLAEHKQQFVQEMKEYMSNVTPEMIEQENAYRRSQRKTGTKRRKNLSPLRDPTKPVLPLNGFFRFSTEVRNDPKLSEEILGVSDAKDIPFAEVGKKIADKWKSMSAEEQDRWQAAYLKEKEVYDKELAQWKEERANQVSDL